MARMAQKLTHGRIFRRRTPQVYVIQGGPEASDMPLQRISAKGERARAADNARARVVMCLTVVCIAFGMLAIKLWSAANDDALLAQHLFTAPSAPPTAELTLAGAKPLAAAGARVEGGPIGGGVSDEVGFVGARGEIFDRNGALLATNLPVSVLQIDGREIWRPTAAAKALASVFPDLDVEAVANKLAARRYAEVRRDLTPAQRDAVFALGLPGVRFAEAARRYYPQEKLASHVLGHLEPGKGGVMGLERVLEARAQGAGSFFASIDIRAQRIVEDELNRAVRDFRAEAGWAAVIDAASGEVLALANAPDFDPNAPGASSADARRNRATYDLYELGSAFKVFTVAAAIDAGVADETTAYDARGAYKIADRTIRDYHGENRIMTVAEIIQHSSNIGAARIAADLGVERQKAAFAALGLFEPLDIELAARRAPNPPLKWGPVESATVSYGHGISVTPLHLLAAFNAAVNGGVYITPTFERGAQKEDAGTRVFKAETSSTMRRILRRVVTDGTAGKAEVDGYYAIGKTATADKVSPSGGYARNARISSFVGAFPGTAPRFSIIVSLDNPKPVKGTHGYATAGWNAAPVFSRVAQRLGPLLQVMQVAEDEARDAFGDDFFDVVDQPPAPPTSSKSTMPSALVKPRAFAEAPSASARASRSNAEPPKIKAQEAGSPKTESQEAGDPLADIIRLHAFADPLDGVVAEGGL